MKTSKESIIATCFRVCSEDFYELQAEQASQQNGLNPNQVGIVEGAYIAAKQILGIPGMQKDLEGEITLDEVESLRLAVEGFAKVYDITLPDKIYGVNYFD